MARLGCTRRTFLGRMIGGLAVTQIPTIAGADCPSDTIRIRKRSNLVNIDPADFVADDEIVVRSIYAPLIRPSASNWVNHLVADIKLDSAGTRVTFKLRSGVSWDDGPALKSEDVRYSFERIVRGLRNSRHREDWAKLDSVRVTHDTSGEIILTDPVATLTDLPLARGAGCVVPRDRVEQLQTKRFTTSPVNMSGRFLLKEVRPDEYIELACYDKWNGDRPPTSSSAWPATCCRCAASRLRPRDRRAWLPPPEGRYHGLEHGAGDDRAPRARL